MQKVSFLFLAFLFLAGCAGHRPKPSALVIPLEGGIYQATGEGLTDMDATGAAIDAARSTCGAKKPVVVAQRCDYGGSNKTAVETVDTVKKIGRPLGVGWMIPTMHKGSDYRAQLSFRCE